MLPHELEQLRRSIVMLQPGSPAGLTREEALALMRDLKELQARLSQLKRELRRLADSP